MTNEMAKQSAFEIVTFDQLERFAKMLAASDFAPKDYRGKPENVVIALQMGHELGLKPMQAIQNIAVVNGRPMVWGDAALALVRRHPECKGVREWPEGTFKNGDGIAHCEVKRGDEIITRSFSVKQATQAGLIGRPTWTQYPERMLQLRARGYALRDSFPDVLKGIYIEGELDGIEEVEYKTIKPSDEPRLGVEAVKHQISRKKETIEAVSVASVVNEKKTTDQELQNESSFIQEFVQENAPKFVFQEIKFQMESANDMESLAIAADAARSLKPEERKSLESIYKAKRLELSPKN